jgi:hypothetical protein
LAQHDITTSALSLRILSPHLLAIALAWSHLRACGGPLTRIRGVENARAAHLSPKGRGEVRDLHNHLWNLGMKHRENLSRLSQMRSHCSRLPQFVRRLSATRGRNRTMKRAVDFVAA